MKENQTERKIEEEKETEQPLLHDENEKTAMKKMKRKVMKKRNVRKRKKKRKKKSKEESFHSSTIMNSNKSGGPVRSQQKNPQIRRMNQIAE